MTCPSNRKYKLQGPNGSNTSIQADQQYKFTSYKLSSLQVYKFPGRYLMCLGHNR